MRGFRIICVGKVKEEYFRDGIASYLKEIRKAYPIDILECPDEPTPENASSTVEEQIKRVEGERILSKISGEDYVSALCIDGKQYSDDKWLRHVLRDMERIDGYYDFVIGGSLGLSREVMNRADDKISFSRMTFPHQMMRMILCEQIAKLTS